jgi:hypothetical protein
MTSQKRKRDSSDSAITDMCSNLCDELLQSNSSLSLTEGLSGLSRHQETDEHDAVCISQVGRLPRFSNDYGTAASMRPRRQPQSQAPANPVALPTPKKNQRKQESSQRPAHYYITY